MSYTLLLEEWAVKSQQSVFLARTVYVVSIMDDLANEENQ